MKSFAADLIDGPDYLFEHSPHGHPMVEKLNEKHKEFLLPILQKGRDQGHFNIENAELAASAISSMLEFMNLDWLRFYPERYRDQVVAFTIEIIINGLGRSDQ